MYMKSLSRVLIAATFMLVFAACANQAPEEKAPPTTAEVEIGQAKQALVPGFCANHPVLCTQWCTNHPVLCGIICDNHPNLPLCDAEPPMCIDLGDECIPVDEEEPDPNAIPCCESEEGPVDCYLNQATQERSCALTRQNGECINNDCDPNGTPCCQSPNPFDAEITCQEIDPQGDPGVFDCIPVE